jgi:hypothetical protein
MTDILCRLNVATDQRPLNGVGVVQGQGSYQVFFRHDWLEVCSKVCVSQVMCRYGFAIFSGKFIVINGTSYPGLGGRIQ